MSPAGHHPQGSGGNKVAVAVLGATGAVGQSFIRLLAGHPWFELTDVAASERSAGKTYGDATRWLSGLLPSKVAAMRVASCDPENVRARIIFSALDSSVAGDVEEKFAASGSVVFTNAKNHRMDRDVPLVIPEINAAHLDLLETQRTHRGWTGAIVANANCAAMGAALPLAALHEAFGLRSAFVVTMQAVSGAGYPGVPSLDILGNVIPFIGGEEPKIETELQKMLGTLGDGEIEPADFIVSAAANRVPVEDGHTICLSVGLRRPADIEEYVRVLSDWTGNPVARGLPSSPDRPMVVELRDDRPQPRRDVHTGRGMAVVIGRIRPDPILDVKLVSLSHNTIRGAAGASLLNAELLASRGSLPT